MDHPLSPLAAAPLALAALGVSVLSFASARRAEQLFERVQDLNRDRLVVLERNLQASAGRSRLEALGSQLDAAAQISVVARRLAALLLGLQFLVCGEALVSVASSPGPLGWRLLDVAWLAGLAFAGGWMWRSVLRAARVAEDSTAHARRYEFLFISELRKEK